MARVRLELGTTMVTFDVELLAALKSGREPETVATFVRAPRAIAFARSVMMVPSPGARFRKSQRTTLPEFVKAPR